MKAHVTPVTHTQTRNHRIGGLLIAAALLAGASFARAAAVDVEFVLDVSGSMRQKLGAETQIESARKALAQALDELPANQLVAVRAYGHRVEQSNKAESCRDTELIVPFKALDKAEILNRVASLVPKGYTPIAHSLQETRNDLYDVGIAREAERVIILLSDGEETCDGDPVQVIRQLEAEGFKVRVYAVGFNVGEVARKQLEQIAEVSGGKYFDAKDAAQLKTSLKEATKESISSVAKEKKTYGNAIRGGNNYEEAVKIPLDTELKLDHHQKKGDFDYFYVEAPAGSELTVAFATLEKGIELRGDGKAHESTNPYFGVQVHDSQRNKLKAADIIGESFRTKDLKVRVQNAGRYYVLIGSIYSDTNGDYSNFKVTVAQRGDLGGSADAGDQLQTALPLKPGRYDVNWIGDTDDADFFSFDADEGDTFTFGVIPNDKSQSWFGIRVIDEFKQELFSETSRSGEGMKSKPFTAKEDGKYFLDLSYKGDDHVAYTLIMKKKPVEGAEEKGGETPPAESASAAAAQAEGSASQPETPAGAPEAPAAAE